MANEIDEPIAVVAYDPRWPSWYAADAEELLRGDRPECGDGHSHSPDSRVVARLEGVSLRTTSRPREGLQSLRGWARTSPEHGRQPADTSA